jgi:hypothetical protein
MPKLRRLFRSEQFKSDVCETADGPNPAADILDLPVQLADDCRRCAARKFARGAPQPPKMPEQLFR